MRIGAGRLGSLLHKDSTVKDALAENGTRVMAGPEASQVATCPQCGGIVDLHTRQTGGRCDCAGASPLAAVIPLLGGRP